ncbi:hypothetical protein [Flavobacterium fluviatile]|uniref:hypothetical protein n=1 Tax=Flavobacterium fluviatile TaxID=1862387 RepID=UPI0013D09F59|nr:hypothetical protein [Flavobacterium fluviatile]
MENNTIINDLRLTYQTGGCIALERLGYIPNYLIFYSASLKRSWRFELKSKKQNGVLKINGVVAFEYSFNDLDCKMKSIRGGKVIKEWKIKEIAMVLND